MISQIRLVAGIAILSQILLVSRATAAPFSGGIVVERVGGNADFTGGASPPASNTAVPIFLDEFSLTTGNRIQTISLPATDPDETGPQRQITENGTATTSGYLSRSANGAYLVTVGFAVPAGTPGLAGFGTDNNRVIARVSASGAIDTSTWYSIDETAQNNATPRSAASNDGLSFYVGTANGTAGTRYVNFGGEDAVTEGIGGPGLRTIAVYENRVFLTLASQFISVKDTATNGLPVGAAAANTLTDIGTITNTNPLQFIMLNLIPDVGVDGTTLDTMYMANANNIDAAASPGGLEKYVFDGTTFNLQKTFNLGLSTINTEPLFGGLEGVAFAGLDGNGKPIIYATTDAPPAVGNALVRLVDTGDELDAFTLVANAPVNTAFRGVALAPSAAVAAVPGDYNNNGVVDAADYVLWRKGGPIQHEVPGVTPGMVTSEDYTAWRQRFGNTSGSGSLSAASVPEPDALSLVGMLLFGMILLSRRSALKCGERSAQGAGFRV